MKKQRSTSATTQTTPRAPAFLQQSPPGADAQHLARAQEQLFAELAPSNRLEASIARDIVAVDTDLALLPKRRNLILWQFAINPMYEQIRRIGTRDHDEAKELALAWATGSQEAEQAIIALGIDPAIAHNQAYFENILLLREIDRQIELLERRRRQLLADYNRLDLGRELGGQRHAREIDDAEIIVAPNREPANVT